MYITSHYDKPYSVRGDDKGYWTRTKDYVQFNKSGQYFIYLECNGSLNADFPTVKIGSHVYLNWGTSEAECIGSSSNLWNKINNHVSYQNLYTVYDIKEGDKLSAHFNIESNKISSISGFSLIIAKL